MINVDMGGLELWTKLLRLCVGIRRQVRLQIRRVCSWPATITNYPCHSGTDSLGR